MGPGEADQHDPPQIGSEEGPLEATHLSQVKTGRFSTIVIITRIRWKESQTDQLSASHLVDRSVVCRSSKCFPASFVSTKRGGRNKTHRSMCKTFFPSTESSPDRTHSVRPVPKMICQAQHELSVPTSCESIRRRSRLTKSYSSSIMYLLVESWRWLG